MSVSARWGLIALVGLATSFTAYYSQYNPKEPHTTTIYLALGLALLVACVFISIFQTRRQYKAAFSTKIGLQEGMKTALLAITLYSLYNYFYLSSFNPAVIESIIAAQTDMVNAANLSDADKAARIANLTNEVTPFKKVTQDLLRLLSVSSMTALMGTIIVKKFPI